MVTGPYFVIKRLVMKGALIVAGIVITVVSLGADAIGVGEGTAIGYKQSIGAVAGVVIAIVGFTRPSG